MRYNFFLFGKLLIVNFYWKENFPENGKSSFYAKFFLKQLYEDKNELEFILLFGK